MKIALFALKNPRAIIGLLVFLICIGIYSYKETPLGYYPNYSAPALEILTLFPGAGAREVKEVITEPLLNAISSLGDIEVKNSTSSNGVSLILVKFKEGVDIELLKIRGQEIVDTLHATKLPKNSKRPEVYIFGKERQNSTIILYLKGNAEPNKLVPFCQQYLTNQLYKIQEINDVVIKGLKQEEVLVDVNIEALQEYKIPALLIYDKLQLFGRDQPIGKVRKSIIDSYYLLQGKFKTLDEVRMTPIRFYNNDRIIHLGELSTLSYSSPPLNVEAKHNGDDVVLLYLVQESSANLKTIVNSVRELIPKVEKQAKIDLEDEDASVGFVLNGFSLIENTMDDLEKELLIAIILIAIVVYLFLGSFWSALITIAAIPISFFGALVYIYLQGFKFDILSLMGLIVALGLVIDDAMISRESIFVEIGKGLSKKRAALEGIRKVFKPVLASTVCLAFVFMGGFFMKGMFACFLFELGSVVSIALIVSFFDSMTIAPLLSAYGPSFSKKNKSGLGRKLDLLHRVFLKFFDYLHVFYNKLMQKVLEKLKVLTLCVALIFFAFSLYLVTNLESNFLPPASNPGFSMQLKMPFQTSKERMKEITENVVKKIKDIQGVKNVTQLVGDNTGSSGNSTLYIKLFQEILAVKSSSEFMKDIKILIDEYKKKEKVPELKPYFFDTSNYAHFSPFVLNVFGPNRKNVERVSKELYTLLIDHPGLTSLDLSGVDMMEQEGIVIDKDKVISYGLDTKRVGEELALLVTGGVPTEFRAEGKSIPIRIKHSFEGMDFKSILPTLSVPNLNGMLVPLGDIATIHLEEVPTAINTYQGYPSYSFNADQSIGGPGLGSVVRDIKAMMEILTEDFPDIRYEFQGTTEHVSKMVGQFFFMVILSLLFIFFVLSVLYESFLFPFILMITLPFGVCGLFYALWIFNQGINIYSFIGFVIVVGVAAKNGILLIDFAVEAVHEGSSARDAIFGACKKCFRPILMTSIALFIGMLPVAIGIGPSAKQEVSMGIAVLGGVFTSSSLSLIILPILLMPGLRSLERKLKKESKELEV